MAGTEHASPIIAARYASALFDIADERHALDQIAGDLETLKRLLSDNAELRAALRNPLYSKDSQGKAVAEIGKAAGLSPVVLSFLGVLAKNRRLFALSAIADAFLAELARRRGQMSVDVTSAQPLTAEQTERLTEKLNQTLAAKVKVNAKVDPSLLGGLVVKIGSRLIDSSIRTKLIGLERIMKGA
ncbi:MAG TPA: F0F1 ATP synthase subunit delta [Alphaproteobacteria bacterium]|nr:F0F1 ATP synthase subunit delta [Alphaproteobacteria bacterium]